MATLLLSSPEPSFWRPRWCSRRPAGAGGGRAIRPVMPGPKSLPLGGSRRQADIIWSGSARPGGDDHDDVLERRRLGLVAGRPDVGRDDRVLGPVDLAGLRPVHRRYPAGGPFPG